MRILVNALSARLGGGQTYLRNLLLNAPQGDWRIFVLCPDNFDMSDMPANVERIHIDQNLSNPYKRAAWENLFLGSLARQLNVQLLFSPGTLLPRFGLPSDLKTAVTFQNMLPYDHNQRQRYPLGGRRVREWLLERGLSAAMHRADLVIFISRFAADFIQAKIGPLRGRSVIIPHGIDRRFMANSDTPLPRPTIAPLGEYYLYVSFVDFYKSQIEVVQAFAQLKQRGVVNGTLLLAGTGYPPYQAALQSEIARLGLDEAVVFSGNLPHEQLPALYQHSYLNIFASRIENCPNILMEMMASGRPALVSHAEPMPEFAGDTVFYFDPANPQTLVRCWTEALSDPDKAMNLARRAQTRIADRSWRNAAESTWRAIMETA